MSKRQNKHKQRKQKQRERNKRKNRQAIGDRIRSKRIDAEIRRKFPLPKFNVVDTDGRSADTKLMVEKGLEKFSRYYPRHLDEYTLDMLYYQRKYGWEGLVDKTYELNEKTGEPFTRDEIAHGTEQDVSINLGRGILMNSPGNLIRRNMPTSCFWLTPGDRDWQINCASLITKNSSAGRVYQSPHKPTINLDGEDHYVVFSRHALFQLAGRTGPVEEWRNSYVAQLHVFGFFYDCVYFEEVQLRNKNRAIVIFSPCLRAGDPVRRFFRDLMGFESESQLENHYCVIGYCPLTLDGNRAIAKTFLTPGYLQTPERGTIKTSGRVELMRDVEQACDEGVSPFKDDEKVEKAIRWFHENGVPQVRKIDREVFRASERELSRWMEPFGSDYELSEAS